MSQASEVLAKSLSGQHSVYFVFMFGLDSIAPVSLADIRYEYHEYCPSGLVREHA